MKEKEKIDPSIPNVQDRVKHKNTSQNTTGIVIAKYPAEYLLMTKPPIRPYLLDVRTDEDKIIYGTPATNWERTATEEERLNE